ncbi:MAG: hypothetical protein P8101_03940 [Candidatus Thiodiazotropha sp.]
MHGRTFYGPKDGIQGTRTVDPGMRRDDGGIFRRDDGGTVSRTVWSRRLAF